VIVWDTFSGAQDTIPCIHDNQYLDTLHLVLGYDDRLKPYTNIYLEFKVSFQSCRHETSKKQMAKGKAPVSIAE
jgi:hypothetical protein